ncbi:uncharacterized protein LOC131683066 [Topomyia yanbarensis]|uniref:uncharacterized protein LOC131683066 n=1 Tax=Topomyia yanbarensis TaxID=2498891 RepID=UPI00273B9C0D|nr:uncharacterized protein LOC131683066 [Topomyia yanbarensis]
MSTEEDFEQYLGSYIGEDQYIALLLDYDGTLAEIPDRPELSVIPPETKKVLYNLVNSGKVFVAIISGRSLEDLRGKVGIDNVIYSGNLGLEILLPDGTRHNQTISEETANNFEKMIDHLTKEVAHNGAWIQNKQIAITLHYREMNPELVPELLVKANQIIKGYGYQTHAAHNALEVNPPIEWNKGLAAELILRTSFDENWKRRKVIFAGDDTPDEDVMKVIKGFGKSFRITRGVDVVTNADFKILSVQSVFLMLKWIEKKMCK